MAGTIGLAKLFAALLQGGYVCSITDSYTGVTKYSVFAKDDSTQTGYRYIGDITHKEFVQMSAEGLLLTFNHAKGKHGKEYDYHKLPDRWEGA